MPSSSGQNLGSGTTPVGFAFNTNTVHHADAGHDLLLLRDRVRTRSGRRSARWCRSRRCRWRRPSRPASVTALTATTATLNGTANPGGGATTGWFRYSATNPGSCSDTFGTRVPGDRRLEPGRRATPASPFSQSITRPHDGDHLLLLRDRVELGGHDVRRPGHLRHADRAQRDHNAVAGDRRHLRVTLAARSTRTAPRRPAGSATRTTNPGTCNDAFGTRVPATGAQDLGLELQRVALHAVRTGLSPTTTYYYCAIAQNSLGTAFGAVIVVHDPRPPDGDDGGGDVVDQHARRRSTAPAIPTAPRRPGWFRYQHHRSGLVQRQLRHARPEQRRHQPRQRHDGRRLRVQHEHGHLAAPGTTYYYCAHRVEHVRHVVRRGAVVHDAAGAAVGLDQLGHRRSRRRRRR